MFHKKNFVALLKPFEMSLLRVELGEKHIAVPLRVITDNVLK